MRDHLEQALTAPTDPARWGSAATEADLYACLADSAVEAMDRDALERYVPLALEAARRLDHRLYLAIGERADGVRLQASARHDEALAAFGRALDSFEALGTRWQEGRTRVLQARSLQALGRHDAARQARERAQALFTQLGARPAVQALEREVEDSSGV